MDALEPRALERLLWMREALQVIPRARREAVMRQITTVMATQQAVGRRIRRVAAAQARVGHALDALWGTTYTEATLDAFKAKMRRHERLLIRHGRLLEACEAQHKRIYVDAGADPTVVDVVFKRLSPGDPPAASH